MANETSIPNEFKHGWDLGTARRFLAGIAPTGRTDEALIAEARSNLCAHSAFGMDSLFQAFSDFVRRFVSTEIDAFSVGAKGVGRITVGNLPRLCHAFPSTAREIRLPTYQACIDGAMAACFLNSESEALGPSEYDTQLVSQLDVDALWRRFIPRLAEFGPGIATLVQANHAGGLWTYAIAERVADEIIGISKDRQCALFTGFGKAKKERQFRYIIAFHICVGGFLPIAFRMTYRSDRR